MEKNVFMIYIKIIKFNWINQIPILKPVWNENNAVEIISCLEVSGTAKEQ